MSTLLRNVAVKDVAMMSLMLLQLVLVLVLMTVRRKLRMTFHETVHRISAVHENSLANNSDANIFEIKQYPWLAPVSVDTCS